MANPAHQSLACFALLAIGACPAPAESREDWRLWTVADSLTESFTGAIAIGQDGRVWLKHGRVESLNVFDGYSILNVQSPKSLGSFLWTNGPDVLLGKDESGRLFEYRQHKWSAHDVYPDDEVPLGGTRVLVMKPERLVEYRTDTRVERVIKRIEDTGLGRFTGLTTAKHSKSGGIWVLGDTGIAQTGPQGTPWREYRFQSLGLKEATQPFEGDDGSLFVVATEEAAGARVLARHDRMRWQVVYRSETGLVRGWPGADGAVWLQEPAGLRLLTGGRLQPVDQIGRLSGTILTVVTEGNGVFWVGTNRGVARYSPPLWRTPPALAEMRSVVQAADEDDDGALWFLTGGGLIRLRGERRTNFPLPRQWGNVTQGIQLLRGPGGAQFLLLGTATGDSLVAFDPEKSAYQNIPPPPGHVIHRILARDAGSLWVCTRVAGTAQYTLQIYDGRKFTEYLRLNPEWGLGVVRAAYSTSDGDLLLGGSGGFGAYRNGVYRQIGLAQGFTDNACFRLCRLADGSIVAGGRDKVFRFDGNSWKPLRSGLDFVRALLQARDGTVWVASGSGVHRYKDGIWTTNDIQDGLPDAMAYELV